MNRPNSNEHLEGDALGIMLSLHLEDKLTDDQFMQLQQTLAADESARDFYIEFITTHAHLEQIYVDQFSYEENEKRSDREIIHQLLTVRRPSSKEWRLAVLGIPAALLAMVMLVTFGIWLGMGFFQKQPPATNQQQAIVLENENNNDKNNNKQKQEEQTITEGTVELLLPTGVKIFITAPATFQMTGKNEITLSQGILLANITTNKGKGFTVKTPRGRVVDLGTVFGVEVDQSGTSSVQVFLGKVELFNSFGVKTSLSSGKAMRCNRGEENWQPSEKLTEKFYQAIQNQSLLPEMVFVGDLRLGMLAADSHQGTSYIMYSATPAQKRFPPIPHKEMSWKKLAQHFVVVQFNESTQEWKVQCNEKRYSFQPVSTDLIIARTQPDIRQKDGTWSRKITSFRGYSGKIHSISYGYQEGNISIRPDWLNGRSNIGEFSLKGTYFVRQEK